MSASRIEDLRSLETEDRACSSSELIVHEYYNKRGMEEELLAGTCLWRLVNVNRKCGRKGNYACMCKEGYKRCVAAMTEEYTEENCSEDRVLMVQHETAEKGREVRPKASFIIASKEVEGMVDSGSLFTIILKALWEK
ncbi:hypothetical protein NDU88_002656 [Pleurodeles waltl]|uniref:Uncharacterized protein n=1 Tax=Pleurodeles waltl TaxID=8319 RepID=A0AAV7M2U7_PLEWA|nr:hypothetical protein NDU88_002656 [Pleurodeles waltl]